MRKPIPEGSILDGFEPLGFIEGERRWRNQAGDRLYTWDGLHGEVEVFDKRGNHLGAIDALNGDWIKNAVRGRRINVSRPKYVSAEVLAW